MFSLKKRVSLVLAKFHVGEKIRKKHVLKLIRAHIKNCTQILDAGCGRGDFVFECRKLNKTSFIQGLDLNSKNITLCVDRVNLCRTQNIDFIEEDLQNLKERARFDLIYSVDVLEHVSDPHSVLKNFYQALKENGKMILHVPKLHQKHILKRFQNWHQEDHVREGFNPNELVKDLRKIGFKDVKYEYTFGFFGTVAWDLFTFFFDFNRLIGLLSYFFLYPFIICDVLFKNKNGNGLLVYARK